MTSYGYLIAIQDNASDSYSYGIPEMGGEPQVIFTSYEDAKVALEEASNTFDEFLPVAYGKAFPYDGVTFEQELEDKSFAPLGWGVVTMDGETQRISVGLLRLALK